MQVTFQSPARRALVAPSLLRVFACFAVMMGFVSGVQGQAPALSTGIDFNEDIQPILQKHCVACHTEDDVNGEFLMDTWDLLIQGGEHGPAITPGEPNSSRMFLMMSGQLEPRMPPEESSTLTDPEVELVRNWIEQGALGLEGSSKVMRDLRVPLFGSAPENVLPITAIDGDIQLDKLVIGRFGRVEIRSYSQPDESPVKLEMPGKVNDIRINSPKSLMIVASGITGLEGAASLIDLRKDEVVRTFAGHRDTLYAAELSPDGTIAATGGYDRQIILWDTSTGEKLRVLSGHNGAIYDLAFSSDGQVLASASADETVKLWKVSTGERLDTLSQPQGEVWAVRFTPDDHAVVAAGGDHRFRVWRFESHDEPRINPLIETRFADEVPLVTLAFTPDGSAMIVGGESGNLRVFETTAWSKVASLSPAGDTIADLDISADGRQLSIATLDGRLLTEALPVIGQDALLDEKSDDDVAEVYFQLDAITELSELQEVDHHVASRSVLLPRGAKVSGTIGVDSSGLSQPDWYRFKARRGEVWIVETHAAQNKSPLDTIIEVCDSQGQSLIRHRLQAVRESYFTFRGKDSSQTNDFRLFDWESMELNDLLYSSGEVTKLWMYPRGPDSGFNVYPGTGQRHTVFDTSPVAHALQEPAYVVQALGKGQEPIENGLPVFELPTLNDDDSWRQIGTDSRVRFVAPEDGEFTVRIDDTRGRGGDGYDYELILRPANPDFKASVASITQPIPVGSGREFRVSVSRLDGYEGPVEFEIEDLPEGVHATSIVTVEAGQQDAYGVVWVDEGVAVDQSFGNPKVIARATILGRVVEHPVGTLGELKTTKAPSLAITVVPDGDSGDKAIRIRPGETISAIVRVDRKQHAGEVKLGNEFAGRNMPHGVFVDNIGLNGLIILSESDERRFFITAAPVVQSTRRWIHLKAEHEGGLTSPPIELVVEP